MGTAKKTSKTYRSTDDQPEVVSNEHCSAEERAAGGEPMKGAITELFMRSRFSQEV